MAFASLSAKGGVCEVISLSTIVSNPVAFTPPPFSNRDFFNKLNEWFYVATFQALNPASFTIIFLFAQMIRQSLTQTRCRFADIADCLRFRVNKSIDVGGQGIA